MTVPLTDVPCWGPVDLSCCPTWADYPTDVQDRALLLATTTLGALTGHRVGGCLTTVRPCRRSCLGTWLPTGYSGGWGLGMSGPLNWAGSWTNIACGCIGNCSCLTVCEVTLPGPVGLIDQVQVDGQVVPPSSYRVDNSRSLVWTGTGDCGWPLCQNMAASPDQPDTFAVSYLRAVPVDALGAYAAGALAAEYAKLCSGQQCRLPLGVTQVIRQGVSYTINPGSFPDGMTGLREVDAWLTVINPNKLKQPTGVWFPDAAEPRVTTWVSQ